MRFTPSTIAERSTAWAPWESHPDPRRRVSTVWCGRVLAATCSAGLGVALTKAALEVTP